ncbi:MAG: hypothetical protein QF724_03720 [Planctomycetota bacterium]|nr:hypothetical protein [Planctomycetota bacterium]MDP6369027.1 hypothetical protein [Planctomycetota bacterium]MDP6519517.1 hypothetical protein [Planctomycetota bacterium]MDP6838022.1 hypothetical protein [Planctomycetota bacterium]
MKGLFRKTGLVLLCAWLLQLSSCLAVAIERDRFERRPDLPEIDILLAGNATGDDGQRDATGPALPFMDLHQALARLGAPLHVAPLQREAIALVYGWRADTHLRASLSLPLAETVSASMDFSRRRAKLDGLVLVFDSSGQLRGSRACRLLDIRARLSGERPVYDDAWWAPRISRP